jgi:lipocalin
MPKKKWLSENVLGQEKVCHVMVKMHKKQWVNSVGSAVACSASQSSTLSKKYLEIFISLRYSVIVNK